MLNPSNPELTINVRLFNKIKENILKFPENFNMSSFTGHRGVMQFNPKKDRQPECGTACCIAGWAVSLGLEKSLRDFLDDEHYNFNIPHEAQRLLGITSQQAEFIFYWNAPRKSLSDTTPQQAADMIDRFLANPRIGDRGMT